MRTAGVVAGIFLALLSFASTAAAQEIEVLARVHHSHYQPLPPPGRGGDVSFAQWLIRDRHGRPIGDMVIDCRWVTRQLRLCVGQMSMPLGTIAVMGASRTRFIGALAVVGGTGHYTGANGTMLFRSVGPSNFILSVNYSEEA